MLSLAARAAPMAVPVALRPRPAPAARGRLLPPSCRWARGWRLLPAVRAWRDADRWQQENLMASIMEDHGIQQPDPMPDRSAELEDNHETGVVFPRLPDLTRDPIKEDARKYRRTVFDWEKWREHRSTERYVRHMRSMTSSRMVRGLSAPLLFIFLVAGGVSTYNTCVEAGIVPALLPELQMQNNGPFGLTSFALSLLLVFRTNASYARWLDARKSWGSLINRSRDITRQWGSLINRSRDSTRQAITYFPHQQDRALLDLVCRWVPAFSRCLMCQLIEDCSIEKELAKVLRPHEVEAVLASKHRPNYCLQILSETLRAAHFPQASDASASPLTPHAIPTAAAYRMDENLTKFADILGTCERILRAPIPLSYTRHTSRFMMIWLVLLPFSLWPSVHWATVPLSVIVAFLLLGIEEIGVSIEEPFSILPLEQLCDTIEANVRDLKHVHARSSGDGKVRAPAARDIVRGAVAEAAAAGGAAAAAAGVAGNGVPAAVSSSGSI